MSQQPEFGKKLKALRKGRGYTLTELSEASGVSRSAIHKLEAGKISNPQLKTIELLCKILRVKMVYFFGK